MRNVTINIKLLRIWLIDLNFIFDWPTSADIMAENALEIVCWNCRGVASVKIFRSDREIFQKVECPRNFNLYWNCKVMLQQWTTPEIDIKTFGETVIEIRDRYRKGKRVNNYVKIKLIYLLFQSKLLHFRFHREKKVQANPIAELEIDRPFDISVALIRRLFEIILLIYLIIEVMWNVEEFYYYKNIPLFLVIWGGADTIEQQKCEVIATFELCSKSKNSSTVCYERKIAILHISGGETIN